MVRPGTPTSSFLTRTLSSSSPAVQLAHGLSGHDLPAPHFPSHGLPCSSSVELAQLGFLLGRPPFPSGVVSLGRVLSRLFLHARPGTPARCWADHQQLPSLRRARQQVIHVGAASATLSLASCSLDRASCRRSAQFLFGNRFSLRRTSIRHDAKLLQHCPNLLSLFCRLVSTSVPT
jgi:hypothetical protein